MRRHTGEKPHGCEECAYRSTTKSDLTKHMRVHLRDVATSEGSANAQAYGGAADGTAAAASTASGSTSREAFTSTHCCAALHSQRFLISAHSLGFSRPPPPPPPPPLLLTTTLAGDVLPLLLQLLLPSGAASISAATTQLSHTPPPSHYISLRQIVLHSLDSASPRRVTPVGTPHKAPAGTPHKAPRATSSGVLTPKTPLSGASKKRMSTVGVNGAPAVSIKTAAVAGKRNRCGGGVAVHRSQRLSTEARLVRAPSGRLHGDSQSNHTQQQDAVTTPQSAPSHVAFRRGLHTPPDLRLRP
jgi:hypothetical protein